MRRWTTSVGGAAVLAATSVAAQGSPTRRELLDRADAASRAGRHGEALEAAEAAGRMQMTPSVRMFVAEEHEALAGDGPRHLVDAARAAEACVREATAQPALNNRERILARCTVLLQRINARIARVRVAGAPAGAEVRLDGEVLPEAEWNTPVEVLPGERVVEVRAAGGGVFRQAARLAAGASETVTVVFAALEAGAGGAAAGGAGEGAGVARDGGEPAAWPRVVGWSLLGVGAVSLGVSVWQWSNTSAYADDAENGTGDYGGAWARYADRINPANGAGARVLTIDQACDRARADMANDADARGAANLCDAHGQAQAMAIAFGVGGGVLAVAGVVLVAASPRARAPRVAVAPLVGPGAGGVAVGGAF